MRVPGVLVLVLAVVGCSSGEPPGRASSSLAHPGPWQIPAEVIAIGDAQDVTYTGAGPWNGGAACTGWTPGAVVLRDWIYEAWPQVTYVGGYACRPVNGDETLLSVHGTGRALDVSIPTVGDPAAADNDLGDPIGNWLIEHAEEIGIQRIIWDRWNWHVGRSPRSDTYGGAHPHHDHLHIELSEAGGRMETAWFTGPMTFPERAPCAEPLPPEGGIVDDGPCFVAFGSATYWREVSGVGEGVGILWTNAFESADPSNWARWEFRVSEAGRYAVEVDSVAEYAIYPAVRYTLEGDGIDAARVIDPSGGGWHSLGEYDLAPGEPMLVSVYDNYAGPVGDEQRITVDAVRIRRLDLAVPDGGARQDAAIPALDAAAPLVDAGTEALDANAADGGAGPGPLEGGCSLASGSGSASLAPLVLLLIGVRRRQRS